MAENILCKEHSSHGSEVIIPTDYGSNNKLLATLAAINSILMRITFDIQHIAQKIV